jgi:hypothetical protein
MQTMPGRNVFPADRVDLSSLLVSAACHCPHLLPSFPRKRESTVGL